MNKKIGTKTLVIGSAITVCVVSVFVCVYAGSGRPTIPKVELDIKFQIADLNKDGVLSEAEFAGYLANLRQTTPASVSITPIAAEIHHHGESESDGCCGGGMSKSAESSSKSGGGCCGGM